MTEVRLRLDRLDRNGRPQLSSVWKAFLDSSEGAQATLYGPRISGGLFGPGVGVGFRKQDQDLVQTFNEAIGAIAADGTLKEISAKWFGADLVPD